MARKYKAVVYGNGEGKLVSPSTATKQYNGALNQVTQEGIEGIIARGYGAIREEYNQARRWAAQAYDSTQQIQVDIHNIQCEKRDILGLVLLGIDTTNGWL